MDKKIVEAVAQRIYDTGGGRMLAGPYHMPPWHEVDPGFQDLFRDIAIAALEAGNAALTDSGYLIVPLLPEDDRVKRGVSALLEFDSRFESEEAAVVRIYEAMNGISE